MNNRQQYKLFLEGLKEFLETALHKIENEEEVFSLPVFFINPSIYDAECKILEEIFIDPKLEKTRIDQWKTDLQNVYSALYDKHASDFIWTGHLLYSVNPTAAFVRIMEMMRFFLNDMVFCLGLTINDKKQLFVQKRRTMFSSSRTIFVFPKKDSKHFNHLIYKCLKDVEEQIWMNKQCCYHSVRLTPQRIKLWNEFSFSNEELFVPKFGSDYITVRSSDNNVSFSVELPGAVPFKKGETKWEIVEPFRSLYTIGQLNFFSERIQQYVNYKPLFPPDLEEIKNQNLYFLNNQKEKRKGYIQLYKKIKNVTKHYRNLK